MLDIQYIRQNPKLVQEKSEQKGYKLDISKLLELDEKRRNILGELETLRQKRNEHSESLKSGKPTEHQLAEGKAIKEKIAKVEKELEPIDKQFTELYKTVPNVPLDSVPIGKSESDNVIAKTVGEKTKFNFEPKNHWEIAENKGWIDKERAAKVAGARFVYLMGDLVLLEFALWQYGLHVLSSEEILKEIIKTANLKVSSKPFTPLLPPAVAKKAVFEATGRLNKEEQTYKIEDEDLWLNASAEHTMAPMFIDEIISVADLPLRFVGYTTAFRREAGTYGKDMEGIFRLHQFNKLEMESFTMPEQSLEEHMFMVAIQEYLMQQLKLSYQLMEKCTADIGFPNAKGVDINVWLPGQNKYRETHTADYVTDFQARSMRTRSKGKDGAINVLHTNDATVFSERPLIAIIENYQTKEGSVKIPEVLKPYMQGKDII